MRRGKLLSIIILVVCLSGVFGYNKVLHVFFQNDYKVFKEIDFNTNSDFENRAVIDHLTDAFVMLEKDSLKGYDAKGNLIWTKPLTSQNTILATGERKIVVAERKAGDIFILNERGEIQSSLLGIGALKDIKIFQDEFLGVVKADGNLNIYDAKLNLLGITKLPTGEMVDFGINTEKQDVVMGILDLSRTDFNSKVVIAGFNGNIISGSNLIQDVIFDIHLTNHYMWIITDHQIRIYDYNSELVKEIDLDRLINVILFDDEREIIYLQLTNDESHLDNPRTKQTLVSYDAQGDLIYDIDLDLDNYTGMGIFNDSLSLFNDSQMVFVDRDGKVKGDYRGKEAIRDVLLTESNTFGIVYDNSIEIYIEK